MKSNAWRRKKYVSTMVSYAWERHHGKHHKYFELNAVQHVTNVNRHFKFQMIWQMSIYTVNQSLFQLKIQYRMNYQNRSNFRLKLPLLSLILCLNKLNFKFHYYSGHFMPPQMTFQSSLPFFFEITAINRTVVVTVWAV